MDDDQAIQILADNLSEHVRDCASQRRYFAEAMANGFDRINRKIDKVLWTAFAAVAALVIYLLRAKLGW